VSNGRINNEWSKEMLDRSGQIVHGGKNLMWHRPGGSLLLLAWRIDDDDERFNG